MAVNSIVELASAAVLTDFVEKFRRGIWKTGFRHVDDFYAFQVVQFYQNRSASDSHPCAEMGRKEI